jgi:hypothetical protein
MTMLRVLLAAAFVAGLHAPAASAQDREVFPGDRVRVTSDERWTGFVQALDSDSIHVIPDGERSARPLALSSVERLEVSVGERGRGRGFLIGGLAGAGVAAGTAALISANHTCEMEPDQFGLVPFCETVGPVAIVASTLIGFAVGGGVGAFFGGGERWVRALLPGRVGALRMQLRLGSAAPGQTTRSEPISVR